MVLFCSGAIIHRHHRLVAESTRVFFRSLDFFTLLLGQCKINIHSNTIKFIGFPIESLFPPQLPLTKKKLIALNEKHRSQEMQRHSIYELNAR